MLKQKIWRRESRTFGKHYRRDDGIRYADTIRMLDMRETPTIECLSGHQLPLNPFVKYMSPNRALAQTGSRDRFPAARWSINRERAPSAVSVCGANTLRAGHSLVGLVAFLGYCPLKRHDINE